MKNCKNILKKALAITFGAALLTSCVLDHSLKNIGEDVALEMSFATKGTGDAEVKGEELVGIEGEVNTLRIFIFLDEVNDRRLAGHYYTTDPVLAPTTIKMDMSVFREGSQKVKFYVIANEAAMLKGDTPVSLSDKTTEEQLKALSFTGIDKNKGLPMFDIKTATINVSGGTVVTADGAHKDHLALDAKIDFVLQRPMAKLTVYAAKSLDTSDDTTLKVTEVTMTKGYAASNGLFAPVTSPDLGSTSLEVRDVACAKLGATNNGATEEEKLDRTNRNNFTQVTESIYPFENAAGSADWQTAVTDGGQLMIKYAFDDGTPQKGIVNLPPIMRNEHIVVNCVMIGNGSMEITLTTLPWDYNERVWDYTKDVTFSQSIVWVSNDNSKPQWDDTEKVVIAKSPEITFSFDIDTPVNATWYATLIPMSNAQSAFKFKNADGTYSKTVSGTIVTTDEPVSLTIWHDDDNQVDTDKALLRVSVKTDAGVTVVHLGTTDVPEYTIIRNK